VRVSVRVSVRRHTSACRCACDDAHTRTHSRARRHTSACRCACDDAHTRTHSRARA